MIRNREPLFGVTAKVGATDIRFPRIFIFFYIHIKYYYKATFYYTLNNYATLQDDAMGAKINVNTMAIT